MFLTLKLYFKSLLYLLVILLSLLLIINILYYNDLISNNIVKYLKIISVIIATFISGFICGNNADNKGYIHGLKLSGIVIIILFIPTLFFKEFKLLTVIYYLIITLSITVGSMVGINKKSK